MGHRDEQRPGDRGVLLDERTELPRRQAVAPDVRLRGDRGRSGALVDQRDLAEEVARAERPPLLAADGHDGFAVLDDEEPDAAAALVRDGLARAERAVGERARQRVDVLVVQALEERDALEEFLGSGHGAILTGVSVALSRSSELLDLPLHAFELRGTDPVQLLAALPELRQLVDADFTTFEPGDDLLELLLRLLERHSTRAPNVPSATRTETSSPLATWSTARTTSSPRRTIA